MGIRQLSILPVVLGGCSLIYNTGDLPPPSDAQEIDAVDAPIDTPFDSNPELLDITGTTPTSVDEGVGSGGGRPVVITLNGLAIVGAAQVSVDLMGSPAPAMLVGFDATPDGTKGGVIVRIPVMTDLDAPMTRTLRITITQGSVTKMADVTVNGRNELRLTAANMNSNALATLYSTIEIASNIHFTGTDPVKLRATAGATVNMRLDGDAAGINGGPHGCNGGAVDGMGLCPGGGGLQGANGSALGLGSGSGGGGGGFGATATNGSGGMAGAGGPASGNDMLVPIDTTAGASGNRGNGGGGGGGGTLQAGGPGGGGGGVVLLEAGGDITVGAMGALRVQGGVGTGNGGSGGGGSGGALLVRSGGTITSTRWLSAPAGAGGAGGNPGGAGAVGRIRVDAAAGDIAAMANTPNAVRGPAWGATIPSLTTTSPLTVQFRGQPGRSFDLRLNDQPMGMGLPGVNGDVDVPVTLMPGRNQLCGVAISGMIQFAEGRTCIELFYAGN